MNEQTFEFKEKLEEMKQTVESYISVNMNDRFKINMYNQKGSTASFQTSNGMDVTFSAHTNAKEHQIMIEAKSKNKKKPLEFKYQHSSNNHSLGTISNRSTGIDFESTEENFEIYPFQKKYGKKSRLTSNRNLQDIMLSLQELTEDMKTMTPTANTNESLKISLNPSKNATLEEIQQKKDYLQKMRTSLIGLRIPSNHLKR